MGEYGMRGKYERGRRGKGILGGFSRILGGLWVGDNFALVGWSNEVVKWWNNGKKTVDK